MSRVESLWKDSQGHLWPEAGSRLQGDVKILYYRGSHVPSVWLLKIFFPLKLNMNNLEGNMYLFEKHELAYFFFSKLRYLRVLGCLHFPLQTSRPPSELRWVLGGHVPSALATSCCFTLIAVGDTAAEELHVFVSFSSPNTMNFKKRAHSLTQITKVLLAQVMLTDRRSGSLW